MSRARKERPSAVVEQPAEGLNHGAGTIAKDHEAKREARS